MQPVEHLVTNATVVTLDVADTVLEKGAVGIRGRDIVYVGPAGGAPAAAAVVDAGGGLVMPGLVNAHTHAAMSLFRGLADDLPLMEWLTRYIFPAESRMDGEFVHTGTLLACAEMLLSGTTTFCDMYLFEDHVARAAKAAGMRCVVGEVLYDFPSPSYGPIENGFTVTEALIRQWRDDPLVSVAVEPHAVYTCSPELLTRARDMALDHGVPLILHLAETRQEIEQVRDRYGCAPVAHLERLGLLGDFLIADHCVHLSDEEMDRLAAAGVRVVHNPESNMKLASGTAPVGAMLARGMAVGLGTDGCASNNNLDMFAEMDAAAKLHKVHQLDPTVLDARQVLRMATVEGARVLGLADRIGSLEPGKRADLIVVDTARAHLTPSYDPVSTLVYAARGGDVRHVFIDGRPVVCAGRLQTLELDDLLDRAAVKARGVLDGLQRN